MNDEPEACEPSYWRFCEILGLSEEDEEEIWSDLIKMKKEGKQADNVAEIMLEKALGSGRNKAYLWGLVTGKFLGLHGV